MEHSPSSGANNHSDRQEIPRLLRTRRFITVLTKADPRPCVTFRNNLFFYGWELLAPHPTFRLEDHPSSAVRDCLLNAFTATLSMVKYKTYEKQNET